MNSEADSKNLIVKSCGPGHIWVCDLKEHEPGKEQRQTSELYKSELQLFNELVNEIPWETVLKDWEADQSWQGFETTFLSVQELSIPVCGKSNKAGRKPARLS